MIKAGAIPALIQLLQHAQPDGQYAAAAALYNLAGQEAEVRLAIVACKALPALVLMLQAESWYDICNCVQVLSVRRVPGCLKILSDSCNDHHQKYRPKLCLCAVSHWVQGKCCTFSCSEQTCLPAFLLACLHAARCSNAIQLSQLHQRQHPLLKGRLP